MKLQSAFIAALVIVFPVASIAQPPYPVTNFSERPLLGQIESTAQLQQDFASNETLIATAGEKLGLSASDMDAVHREVNRGNARYVTLPRHLDGMSGAKHGVAFAHHNVVIPPNVHGWEVDLAKPTGTLRVFIPNRCGNVSYLFEHHRVLAAAPIAFVPAPPESAPPVASPSYEPPAVPSPVPLVAVAPSVPVEPATHRAFGFLPWLALGLIGVALSGHGGGGGTVVPPVINQPTPIPIHTICPSPVPH